MPLKENRKTVLCFHDIEDKIRENNYTSISSFIHDVDSLLNHANKFYDKEFEGSFITKNTNKLKKAFDSLVDSYRTIVFFSEPIVSEEIVPSPHPPVNQKISLNRKSNRK